MIVSTSADTVENMFLFVQKYLCNKHKCPLILSRCENVRDHISVSSSRQQLFSVFLSLSLL